MSNRVYAALLASVFGVVPEHVLRDLAETVPEARLLAGHMLYDPEVTVLGSGLVRAFIANPTGRQLTVAYSRPGHTLALAHLAGRRYPTAFQALEDSQAIVIGNDRAVELQDAHPGLGWAAAREFSVLLDELETELARVAFGTLRQRLAAHLLALTIGHQGSPYPVHLTRLAAAVASSREVVYRKLRPLVEDGSISLGPDGATGDRPCPAARARHHRLTTRRPPAVTPRAAR
jgi:CRP/FNR family transcriptional regulator